jgi:hypothetical protein
MIFAAGIFISNGIMFAMFDILPLIAKIIGRDAQKLDNEEECDVRPIELQPEPAKPVLLSYRKGSSGGGRPRFFSPILPESLIITRVWNEPAIE